MHTIVEQLLYELCLRLQDSAEAAWLLFQLLSNLCKGLQSCWLGVSFNAKLP